MPISNGVYNSKFGITQEQRDAIMASMRAAKILDSQTATVFGLSRERVRQLLGNSTTQDKIDLRAEIDARCIDRENTGETIHEIATSLGVNASYVNSRANQLPHNKVKYKQARLARGIEARREKHDAVIVELKKWVEMGATFCSGGLQQYHRSLFTWMSFYQPLQRWAEEIGVSYVRYGPRSRNRKYISRASVLREIRRDSVRSNTKVSQQ